MWRSAWFKAKAPLASAQARHSGGMTTVANLTRQDAATLNVERAYEAVLDTGQHLVRRERLGVPQSARDVFKLLAQTG